jgi:Ca2+-binding EF-hand superfamily protein
MYSFLLALSKTTPPNRYEMNKAFQELDKDRDQQISFHEFQLMVKEIIKLMIGDQ